MNKKAQQFNDYLKDNKIEAFAVEEVKEDKEFNACLFRSNLEINGSQLPTVVILDDSIYGLMRTLIAPKVEEAHRAAVLELLNSYNRKFKSFKYYLEEDGAVILDISLITIDEISGDLIYGLYNEVVVHLEESYKDIMAAIWGSATK